MNNYTISLQKKLLLKSFGNKQRTKYDTDIMITIDDKMWSLLASALDDSLGSGGINNCSKLKKLQYVVLIQKEIYQHRY